jgi:hypothetical protein
VQNQEHTSNPGMIFIVEELAQQLNYDDTIDGFADAKARKVWGSCCKVSMFIIIWARTNRFRATSHPMRH